MTEQTENPEIPYHEMPTRKWNREHPERMVDPLEWLAERLNDEGLPHPDRIVRYLHSKGWKEIPSDPSLGVRTMTLLPGPGEYGLVVCVAVPKPATDRFAWKVARMLNQLEAVEERPGAEIMADIKAHVGPIAADDADLDLFDATSAPLESIDGETWFRQKETLLRMLDEARKQVAQLEADVNACRRCEVLSKRSKKARAENANFRGALERIRQLDNWYPTNQLTRLQDNYRSMTHEEIHTILANHIQKGIFRYAAIGNTVGHDEAIAKRKEGVT